MFGWNNGNAGGVSGGTGNVNRGYGFSGWNSGYGRSGYGYGYGNGGWGSGYGYGSGYGNNNMRNGQYVWVFIPALGWVYVPIRLLLMLGR